MNVAHEVTGYDAEAAREDDADLRHHPGDRRAQPEARRARRTKSPTCMVEEKLARVAR